MSDYETRFLFPPCRALVTGSITSINQKTPHSDSVRHELNAGEPREEKTDATN